MAYGTADGAQAAFLQCGDAVGPSAARPSKATCSSSSTYSGNSTSSVYDLDAEPDDRRLWRAAPTMVVSGVRQTRNLALVCVRDSWRQRRQAVGPDSVSAAGAEESADDLKRCASLLVVCELGTQVCQLTCAPQAVSDST
jgi:hypothetical protein